jgi:hypothetical protein
MWRKLGCGVVLVYALAGTGSAGGRSEQRTAAPIWGAPVQAGTVSDGHDNELATVDLNGDGLLDVVVADEIYNQIQPTPPMFLLNKGGGKFVDATASLFDGSPPAAQWDRQMVVADFNGDGRPDFFIADIGTDNTTINPGYPGAQNELILSEPGGKYRDATANLPQRFTFTHSAAAADVNGDGAIDIFENNVGGLGRSHDQAEILLNDGGGHFTIASDRLRNFPRDVYGNTHSYACAFADVNGDGHPDLIIGGGESTNRSAVMLNDGHGYFDFFEWLPPKLYAANALVLSIASTDVNGDGAPDLLLAESQQNPYYVGSKVQVLINDGQGHFSDETATRFPNEPNAQSWPERLMLEDFNGDGRADVFLQYAPPGIVPEADPTPVWLNENGVFVPIKAPEQGPPPGSRGMVGFVNGDGPHAFFSLASIRDNGPAAFYVSPQIVPPAGAPASVRAQPAPAGNRLSWRPVQGATRYEIWRGQPKTLLATTTGTSYLDTSAPRGKASNYTLRARNAAGPGPFSPPVISRRRGK